MGKHRKPGQRRARTTRPYESKQMVRQILGFDTDESFEAWRSSELVHPTWEKSRNRPLDTPQLRKLTRDAEFQEIQNYIRDGEERGREQFSDKHLRSAAVKFDTDTEWHAWALWWLVDRNTKNWAGCFFEKHLEEADAYKGMFYYIV